MESNDQNLLRILAAEPKKKKFTFKVGEKVIEVEMRTLTQSEMDEAMTQAVRGDFVARGEAEKIPVLSYAIVSINGVPLTSFDNVKVLLGKEGVTPTQAIRKVLGEMGINVINLLFVQYIKLIEEDKKERGEAEGFF